MDVTGVMKSIHLNDADMNVTIIGNFDVLDRRIDPNFQSTGTWYDYFSGEEITVANMNSEIILKAGEYHLYTDVKLDTPDIVADIEKIGLEMNNLVKLNIFPNPAKDKATISVVSDEYLEQVSISIYNIHGTLVRNLYSGKLLKGQNEFSWDLKNINGQKVPSGIYFSTIQAKNFLKNRLLIVD